MTQTIGYLELTKEQKALYHRIVAQAISYGLRHHWETLSNHVPARFISGLVLCNGRIVER